MNTSHLPPLPLLTVNGSDEDKDDNDDFQQIPPSIVKLSERDTFKLIDLELERQQLRAASVKVPSNDNNHRSGGKTKVPANITCHCEGK